MPESALANEAAEGFTDRLRQWADRVKSAPAAIEAVLQTALLPLAFLWIFWRLAWALVGGAAPMPGR